METDNTNRAQVKYKMSIIQIFFIIIQDIDNSHQSDINDGDIVQVI